MVEFISQYQYPLIGLGILIIMGLVGYLADQKESGKIAEYKKERKNRLEEKKKIKEQQKAEKMKLQEEKKKLKEQKAQEKAESKTAKEENQVAVVPGVVSSEEVVETSKNSEVIDDTMSNMGTQEEAQTENSYMETETEPAMEIANEEAASESTLADVFVIEEPNVLEGSIDMSTDSMTAEPETVSFEPATQNEQSVGSYITESGEDLSVPFTFGNDNVVEENQTVDTLKSESSVAFNSLLEEVQAEESSLLSSDEDQFLQSMNTTTATPSLVEEDDALKVFMQPTVSNNQSNDMTSDSLDEWKL